MSIFDSLFSAVRDRNRRITVYADEETEAEGLFANHTVDVAHRETPAGGPEPFLVLEADGEFAGAIALADLDGLLEPPLVRPGERDGLSRGYRVLFDLLDEQVFTAMERSQLLAVSREIEDRAFRVGAGEFRVSFQSRSAFEAQAEVYRHLGEETDLDVHVYAVADWSRPPIEGITYHETTADRLGQYWALAFDGGPDWSQTCGLLAREQSDGYEGFWTDDPAMVEEILDGLRQS